MNTNELREAINQKLKTTLDPETGLDIFEMRLVRNLEIEPDGKVRYTIQPSSPQCPVALLIGLSIRQAIQQLEGVTAQEITVVNHAEAEILNNLLNSPLEN